MNAFFSPGKKTLAGKKHFSGFPEIRDFPEIQLGVTQGGCPLARKIINSGFPVGCFLFPGEKKHVHIHKGG